MSPAAVRIDRSSSSRVVAPSASAEMVRVATRMGSTPSKPSDALAIELTILLTSTGSSAPLRFFTRMPPAVGCEAATGGAGVFAVSVSVGAALAAWAVSVVAAFSSITVTVGSPAHSLHRRAFGKCLEIGRETAVDHQMSWSLPAIGTTCRGKRVCNYSSETTGLSTVSSRNCQLAWTVSISVLLTLA